MNRHRSARTAAQKWRTAMSYKYNPYRDTFEHIDDEQPIYACATVGFTHNGKIGRVCVGGKEEVDFLMSEKWHIKNVIVTENRRAMVITLERGEEE